MRRSSGLTGVDIGWTKSFVGTLSRARPVSKWTGAPKNSVYTDSSVSGGWGRWTPSSSYPPLMVMRLRCNMPSPASIVCGS